MVERPAKSHGELPQECDGRGGCRNYAQDRCETEGGPIESRAEHTQFVVCDILANIRNLQTTVSCVL